MHKQRIGVLRGGPGRHYQQSLASGHAILSGLTDSFEGVDIFVDRSGVWHLGGVPTTLPRVRDEVDVVINALHGAYGSDGQLQRQLELHHIPYTASGVTGSAHAYNRPLTKDILGQFDIRTPHGVIVRRDDPDASRTVNAFFTGHPGPYVIKDIAGFETSMRAHTLKDVRGAVEQIHVNGGDAIVEEFIAGDEAVVGVIDRFRGERYYATVPSTGSHKEIEDLAKQVHMALGLRDYSVIHIINSRRGLFVIKAIAQPELHEESYFKQALDAVGCAWNEFWRNIVTTK